MTIKYRVTVGTSYREFISSTEAQTYSIANNNAPITEHQIPNNSPTIQEIAFEKVKAAMQFGGDLALEFASENVALGITQLGLTNHVRKTLTEVQLALSSGSLYDAIYEIKQVPVESLDQYILTPARLLTFRNKIESYLGVNLASEWNE